MEALPVAPRRLADRLTSRGGAWAALAIALFICTILFAALGGAEAPPRTGQAPTASEAARADALLAQFPDADRQAALVVATREDGAALSSDDAAYLEEMLPALDAHTAAPASGPILSDDGQAAILIAPTAVGADSSETGEHISALRHAVGDAGPQGLTLEVTGGPAFGADVAAAFDGADTTLLLVTILIVAVLLILTYRSPILWLLPLIVIALADGLAGRAAAAAGAEWGFAFDAGIVSVLVFGAGANYALLLISRYREELQRTADDRAALASAWRKSAPAILASNLTVVLALLTLLAAVIPQTRGLGVPAAIGLIIAVCAVLFVLTPVLALCGRRVFWPFIPRPDDTREQGRAWRGVATRVTARPRSSLAAGAAVLAVLASGLMGTSLGLDQLEKFRVESESAAGLVTLSAHFPAGEAQPIWIVAPTADAAAVESAATGVSGIVRAHSAGETDDGALTRVLVTSEHSPGTPESLTQISELRDAMREVPGSHPLVGGAVATELDAREGAQHDLRVIAPLVLTVCGIVLLLLLRSAIAPIVLLLVNLASAVAAIGAGSWLSRTVLDQPALDLQVPILSFLFLVALGVDYTIFLTHRARHEASRLGTRAGMVEAVASTGGVITSAGIVLAAVFSVLGVLPLVTLGQLGLIVGIGVLLDTLVVRTVIVPAVFTLFGDRMWWPANPHTRTGELPHESRTLPARAY